MINENSSNIYRVFEETAKTNQGHPAVIYLGTTYSYGELLRMVERFSVGLNRIGVQPGQRVMIYLPNSINWVVSWLAVLRLGGVCVPLTPIYTPYDLEYIAGDSMAETLICSDTNLGYATQVFASSPLKRIVVTNVSDLLPWWKRLFGFAFNIIPNGKVVLNQHTFSLRKLIRSSPEKLFTKEMPEDEEPLAQILYTGGTIKRPKAVPLTHRFFLVSALEQITVSNPLFKPEENVILCNAPLFHILGQTCGLSTLLMGGVIILQPKINLDATFSYIERFKANTLLGVPALYRMILEHDRSSFYDFSSLRYCFSAGDVLPIEVRKHWLKRFDKVIYQGYGATETCGGTTMSPVDMDVPDRSVGRVVPSKHILIVDHSTLEPVKLGEPGELLVSSPDMVSSYLNQPEETKHSFLEMDGKLWYRTADIMMMDEREFLYFVDRTADTIKHKGYRVSSSEVEAVLQEHPSVMSACVIGIPDKDVGERIKAFVVLKEGIKGITGYDLIHWSREKLVAYKVPQYIEFRDMLPKSKVGKLLRREIRKQEKNLSSNR